MLFEVRESAEAACGIFYADFAGTVKSCALGPIDIHAGRSGFNRFEIVNLEVEKRRSL